MVVDLPAPLGPRKPSTSPLTTVRSIPPRRRSVRNSGSVPRLQSWRQVAQRDPCDRWACSLRKIASSPQELRVAGAVTEDSRLRDFPQLPDRKKPGLWGGPAVGGRRRFVGNVGWRSFPGRQGLGGWVKLPVECSRQPTVPNMEGQRGMRGVPNGAFSWRNTRSSGCELEPCDDGPCRSFAQTSCGRCRNVPCLVRWLTNP